MGIVNIDDELHDQIRRACTVSHRSINAQANFWIRIGMMCELNTDPVSYTHLTLPTKA